jgi:hypothetical protein
MKKPTIYIVVDEFCDYGLRSYSLVTWFFDQDEAEEFAKTNDTYTVEECPGDIKEKEW